MGGARARDGRAARSGSDAHGIGSHRTHFVGEMGLQYQVAGGFTLACPIRNRTRKSARAALVVCGSCCR